MKNTFVTIIIPYYVSTPRFFRDLRKFRKLKHKEYEILVVSDKKIVINEPEVRVVLTGLKRSGPAEKRDIAIKKAKGEICAFIDDDAYPHPHWLSVAIPLFKDKGVVAVGGPGITPKEDKYWEQITGDVYGSILCGGFARHRFVPAKSRLVYDYPAYNLLVKTVALKKIGGYGNHFYGGEDTFLCMKLNKIGKIVYHPKVLVYHHRRALFRPYLKQISNIGLHRGYFARVYKDTSSSFWYFLPTILACGFFSGLLASIFFPQIRLLYISLLMLSICAGALSVSKRPLHVRILASIGIILTHITYGLYFIRGYFTNHLER